jgi:ATP-dependent RNA helicase DDX10/DBP4
MKSIYLQKDKITFDLSEYPAEAFAASLGLPGAPQIKFGNQKVKEKKRGGDEIAPVVEESIITGARDVVASDDEDEDESEVEEDDEVSGDEDLNDDEEDEAASDEDEQEGSASDSDDAPKVCPIFLPQVRSLTYVQTKTPAVRTKYDRMFERKNQSILAPHYSALISHEDAEGEGGDDDVFTLARKDHDIDLPADDSLFEETPVSIPGPSTSAAASTSEPLISSEDLSKRKLKAATSKKALLKSRPAPEKVIFDEETGEARDFYTSGKDVETLAGDQASRQKFLQEERERMREAHRIDKEVAREKKREKKRKRQERETRGGDDEDDDGLAVISGGEADGGDDFINGLVGMLDRDGSEGEEEEAVSRSRGKKSKKSQADTGLEDEEALALRLLQGG